MLGRGWLTLGAAGRMNLNGLRFCHGLCHPDQLTIVLSCLQYMLNIIGSNRSISVLQTRNPHADHLAIVLSCCRNVRGIFGTK
jgi:hypothetical protein